MSGASRFKAEALYAWGHDDHYASFVAHYLDGLSNVVDFSSGWSKVGLIGVPVLVGGLTLISPIAGAMLASTMLVAGATAGTLMLIFQGATLVAALVAGTEGDAKEAMRGVGTSTGILALSLPGTFLVPRLLSWGRGTRSLASQVPHLS